MSGVFTDLTLRDFSLGTNNLPLANTPKLRNRFGRWWNRSHPYDRLPTNEPEPLRETSFQEAAGPEETRIDIAEDEINAGEGAAQAETSFSTGVEETALELGEAATETTGLLGGATAGSAAAGTAGTLGTVAATAAGGAALAGIGIGIKKLIDHTSSKGAVLPGTDFVGPGNPIDPKPARSETDQIAKEHDLGYEDLLHRAKSQYFTEEDFKTEVYKLDDEAIHRFSEEYQKSGTWQAFVGKYGLKAKRLIEDVIGGPVYPQQPKKQPPRAEEEEVAPATPTADDILDELPEGNPEDIDDFDVDQLPSTTQEHHPTTDLAAQPGRSTDPDPEPVSNPIDSTPPDEGDSSSMSAPLTPPITPDKTQDKGKGKRGGGGRPPKSSGGKRSRMAGTSLPGAGADIAGEGGGQAIIPIPRPITTPHNNFIIFNKVHRFLTYGLANVVIPITRTVNDVTYVDNFVITSLGRLPVDRPFLYMNPNEFAQLPPGSCIEECNVRVTAFTPRIAFQTNSSNTGLATLNQNQFILHATGLNIKTQGVDVRPKEFQANEPMVVSSIDELGAIRDENLFEDYVKEFYGDKSVPNHVPRHQFGIPYPLKNYFALVLQQNGTADNPGYECLQSHVNEIRCNGPSGEIVEYNYKPQLGLIKKAIPAVYTGVPSAVGGNSTLSCPAGAGNSQYRTADFTMTNNILRGDSETFKDTVVSNTEWTIATQIEKSQILHAGAFPSYTPRAQPSLHIGVKPVHALTTANLDDNLNNANFTDTQAYFIVEAACKVRLQYPSIRPLFNGPNTIPDNQIYSSSTLQYTHAVGKSTIMGLQQK